MAVTRRRLFAGSLGAIVLGRAAAGQASTSLPYRWRSVAIVGGGFVDGFVFHPAVPQLMYARTDMGGAYRRDADSGIWQPLLDWLPYADLNLMGVESIAVDPADADKVYLACGTYSAPSAPDGAVLRSNDRGRSFRRTNLPVKFGGNEEGRGNGDRLAVDPNDGRVLYLGTRLDGLWRSTDGAASFQRVDAFPAAAWQRSADDGPLAPGRGSDGRSSVVFVVIDPASDPASRTGGRASRSIYVGVSALGRPNLWRSQDGGASWSALADAPTAWRPTRAAWGADGRLFVSYAGEPGPRRGGGGAVWAFDSRRDSWAEIAPERPTAERRFGYVAVAVDAQDPRRLLASTHGRPGGDELFRSTDGGASWRPLFAAGAAFDAARAPYVRDTHLHWLFDVRIDPANPDHAIFSTGYGGWETFDLRAADEGRPTHWRVMSSGIEETVALALHSPTRGVPLVSAIGDYSGFVHADLDQPAAGNPKPPFLGNTHDVSGAELTPDVIVRVGRPRVGTALGYSLDGGRSWREPAAVPDARAREGAIAVSADGATWVWTPAGMRPHVSRDRGASWTALELPPDMRVVADRVNPRRFHAMALFDDRLYASQDAAASFSESPLGLPDGPVRRLQAGQHHHTDRGDIRGGQDRLYATPGIEDDLWLPAFHGLYHRAPGQGFVRMAGVSVVHGFGFGRAAPGSNPSTLYLVGTVQGQHGIFRSTDAGARWQRINDDAHQWGLILQIAGDPKVFGRVYVGTHGRGVLYGDPA